MDINFLSLGNIPPCPQFACGAHVKMTRFFFFQKPRRDNLDKNRDELLQHNNRDGDSEGQTIQ